MRAPGALHHARFLASGLYIMKLVMLSNSLPAGLVTPAMLVNLKRMAVYIALFHGPWFLQARVPAVAPRLDLQLWNDMRMYEVGKSLHLLVLYLYSIIDMLHSQLTLVSHLELDRLLVFQDIDAPIAASVKQSITRHLWYLTEQLVIFGLFDADVEDTVKQTMAELLHRTPRPQAFPPGKPVFPAARLEREPRLPILVGPNSWLLFNLLGMTGDWLALPPAQWHTIAEFRSMQDILNNISVVNDAAERGIKDITDYANAARDGTCRERIVLVSNSHRMKIPSFMKNEMNEKL